MTMTVEATPSRPNPPSPLAIDGEALHRWLLPRLSGVPASVAGLQMQRLAGGQSNPTWLLRAGDGPAAWILRAKPGPAATLLPSAHAIEREARVMRALQGSAVPVPQVLLECDDESVIGAAFYVMAYVDGRVLRDPSLPEMDAAGRAAIYDEANRVIAALHQVDWHAAGLGDFGRTDGYFERITARWERQYRATQMGAPVPAMERLAAWLPAHQPPPAQAGEVALVHGDYRLENLIFHPTRPQVLAVLDWELATLGHPLADLAYHTLSWHLPAGILRGLNHPDGLPAGVPDARDHVLRYLARTGRLDRRAEVEAHWPFYVAFNLFRLAAILQGVAHRAASQRAAHPDAAEIGRMAGPVADLGWAIAAGERLAM